MLSGITQVPAISVQWLLFVFLDLWLQGSVLIPSLAFVRAHAPSVTSEAFVRSSLSPLCKETKPALVGETQQCDGKGLPGGLAVLLSLLWCGFNPWPLHAGGLAKTNKQNTGDGGSVTEKRKM